MWSWSWWWCHRTGRWWHAGAQRGPAVHGTCCHGHQIQHHHMSKTVPNNHWCEAHMTECNHRDNYMPLYENANVPTDDRLVPPGGYGITYCGHMIPNHSYFVYDVIMISLWCNYDNWLLCCCLVDEVSCNGIPITITNTQGSIISCSRFYFAVTCSVHFVFSLIACEKDKPLWS